MEGIPREQRPSLTNEIANFVKESILDDVGGARSPLTGSSFPGLSSEYKKRKSRESGRPIANLELEGDMLDALEIRTTAETFEVGIYENDELGKADGHNNFSGRSRLPNRRFIPNEAQGDTFRRGILEGIERIVNEAKDGGKGN